MARVNDGQQRLEPPQGAVGSPFLGQLRGGPRDVGGKIAELGFEPLQQRERIGAAAGKPRDHLSLGQTANLHGVGLEHGIAQAHLAVAADGHDTAMAHAEDRRSADFHPYTLR